MYEKVVLEAVRQFYATADEEDIMRFLKSEKGQELMKELGLAPRHTCTVFNMHIHEHEIRHLLRRKSK